MKIVLFLLIAIFSFGCGTKGPTPQESTPSFLEGLQDLGKTLVMAEVKRNYDKIEEYQIRLYERTNVDKMKDILLKVLEKEGFKIETKSIDSITAKKQASMEFLAAGGYAAERAIKSSPILMPHTFIEPSINVKEQKNQIRVSINFKVRVYGDESGFATTSEQVTDSKYYNDFFAKVEKLL